MLAARKGDVEIARWLVDAGADKDLQGHDGYTAVRLAEDCGCGEVATLLRAKVTKTDRR